MTPGSMRPLLDAPLAGRRTGAAGVQRCPAEQWTTGAPCVAGDLREHGAVVALGLGAFEP